MRGHLAPNEEAQATNWETLVVASISGVITGALALVGEVVLAKWQWKREREQRQEQWERERAERIRLEAAALLEPELVPIQRYCEDCELMLIAQLDRRDGKLVEVPKWPGSAPWVDAMLAVRRLHHKGLQKSLNTLPGKMAEFGKALKQDQGRKDGKGVELGVEMIGIIGRIKLDISKLRWKIRDDPFSMLGSEESPDRSEPEAQAPDKPGPANPDPTDS